MKYVPYKKDNLHSVIDYSKLIKIESMMGEDTLMNKEENKTLIKTLKSNRRKSYDKRK